MGERIAGPRGTGKPLQIAVDDVTGASADAPPRRLQPLSAAATDQPTADDPYEDEAYRLWVIKQRSK